MEKLVLDWLDIERYCNKIAIKILLDGFLPDYIVGITRGGAIPAVMLSHVLDIPMHTLKVTLRDGKEEDCDHNCWMAEEVFGYVFEEEREILKCRWDPDRRKNVLILDDINDTGATFNWIKEDWMSSCLPNELDAWQSVWHNNVRFASLVENLASEFKTDYSALEINKAEKDCWIVYPWEKE